MNVMTPSTPLSLPFLPVLLPSCPPSGLARIERQRPPLELVAVVPGKLARRAEVFRLADDLELQAGEHGGQAVLLQRDGQVGDVDADPAPAQLLRGRDRGAAAAERVEHHVAGVAAGLDDALQEGKGLLGGVAEALG